MLATCFVHGQFRPDKVRPIFVKLQQVWDKRLILKSSWKLKPYPERVFVWSDEPLKFERIEYRAERDGKLVTVDNDMLIY
jgi:hypothetical protein